MLVILAVSAGFAAVAVRLVSLHIVDGPELLELVERNRFREDVLPFRRGSIVDSRGQLLAFSRTLWTVGVDPALADSDMAGVGQLAELLELEPGEVAEALVPRVRAGRPVRWVKLAERVEEDVYEAVRALRLRGVYGVPTPVRIYPAGALASHLLGFVNAEGTAAGGIEHAMDFYLRGQEGWRRSERDGRRREMAQFRQREVGPRHGWHVELTVDQVIQDMAEEALSWAKEAYRPKSASLIVSEAATGRILALANLPTFDLNAYWRHPLEEHRNIALTDLFEPGSTFKIVAASAVLEEELVVPEDRFDVRHAAVPYRGRMVRLPSDHRPFEELSMQEVVVYSSNRGAAHLGMLLGERRLHHYAERFGFGSRTGLGLMGETSGILHPVQNWDGLTITRLPMGHAVSATPLQVHMAMSVLANDGILMEPRVVRRIFDEDGNTILEFGPSARWRVISRRTARTMSAMLAEVAAETGTARRAHIEGFAVAGKTGTTQKLVDGRYSNHHHVASFSGFFPAHRPEVVVTVVIDEPDFGQTGFGGQVAAPVFQRLGARLAQYLGIEPVTESERTIIVWKGNETDGPR